jgi:hypothetical protein
MVVKIASSMAALLSQTALGSAGWGRTFPPRRVYDPFYDFLPVAIIVHSSLFNTEVFTEFLSILRVEANKLIRSF